MNKRILYSPELREHTVRLVLASEHEHPLRWAAIQSVAAKIGTTPKQVTLTFAIKNSKSVRLSLNFYK